MVAERLGERVHDREEGSGVEVGLFSLLGEREEVCVEADEAIHEGGC